MNKALVITSIANDQHPVLKIFSEECAKREIPFLVIGDMKSPDNFNMEGCDFWSVSRQKELNFSLAKLAPYRHYSRKNLGYLIAIKNGANEIIETDDDNIPRAEFWDNRQSTVTSHRVVDADWVNVYQYFTEKFIWPRGYPLEDLHKKKLTLADLPIIPNNCPIQQGLADENPDVDAVYRLTYPLPISFEIKARLAMGRNSWSPFNSQNTYWFEPAFPLLYLPSYCSFRMTDIWRSYVAQRIAWECDWSVLFHEPTVWQERNEHNLMKDFEDEISGYTNNKRIVAELQSLNLKRGENYIFENLVSCYTKLVEIDVIGGGEIQLLQAWIKDLNRLKKQDFND